MKYGILLKILRFLVYIKRFFWWSGARFYFVLAGIFGRFWRFGAFFNYKVNYALGKSGLKEGRSVFFKRDLLQFVIFIVLVLAAIPQTKVYTQKDTFLPGQQTIAYRLTGSDEDYSLEEVLPDALGNVPAPAWKQSAVALTPGSGAGQSANLFNQQVAGTGAGGSALFKPVLIPGAIIGVSRSQATDYVVEPGDTLGTIADDFGVSVATIIWANNLSLRSIIRPGDKLVVPPTTGVMHVVKKGDSIKKIAKLYAAKEEDIIKFNRLKADGSDLVVGEKIMVPNGVKPQEIAIARIPRTSPSYNQVAVPPGSTYGASASGFIWPTAARIITQYYSWRHQGIDIAGPYLSANYATKAGTVELAQCGWNNGWGCTILINHGGGVKSRYSHNARILVVPGQYVEAGQTIGLMGNTGHVRGVTGIHLDFRLYINGVQVNPLGYVR